MLPIRSHEAELNGTSKFCPMNSPVLSRRHFIRSTSTAAAAGLLPLVARAADKPSPTRWPIGCFNRPWTKWSFDEAHDSIKAAGYQWTGLLSAT
jgi:hypothetical protein